MRYEVRCCCRPKKLLGWLEAPPGVESWHWPLLPKTTSGDMLKRMGKAPSAADFNHEEIRLPIELFRVGIGGRYYLAIKAEGVSIEKLRRAFTFEEAR